MEHDAVGHGGNWRVWRDWQNPGQDEVRQHLAELGFVMGERVTVVSKMGGNLICAVKDSRVALSQSMAMRVLVN